MRRSHRAHLQRILESLPPSMATDDRPLEQLVQQVVRDKDNMERQIEVTIAEHTEQQDDTDRMLVAERKRVAELKTALDDADRRAAAHAAEQAEEGRYASAPPRAVRSVALVAHVHVCRCESSPRGRRSDAPARSRRRHGEALALLAAEVRRLEMTLETELARLGGAAPASGTGAVVVASAAATTPTVSDGGTSLDAAIQYLARAVDMAGQTLLAAQNAHRARLQQAADDHAAKATAMQGHVDRLELARAETSERLAQSEAAHVAATAYAVWAPALGMGRRGRGPKGRRRWRRATRWLTRSLARPGLVIAVCPHALAALWKPGWTASTQPCLRTSRALRPPSGRPRRWPSALRGWLPNRRPNEPQPSEPLPSTQRRKRIFSSNSTPFASS